MQNLIDALRNRLAVDGQLTVEDADLLIWVATSLNGGTEIQPGERTVTVYMKLDRSMTSDERRKIAAIKAYRVMAEKFVGVQPGLKDSKDLIDEVESYHEAEVPIAVGIPYDLAIAEVTRFNAASSGWKCEVK